MSYMYVMYHYNKSEHENRNIYVCWNLFKDWGTKPVKQNDMGEKTQALIKVNKTGPQRLMQ